MIGLYQQNFGKSKEKKGGIQLTLFKTQKTKQNKQTQKNTNKKNKKKKTNI